MPEIDFHPAQIMAIQRILDEHDIEIPDEDEIMTADEYEAKTGNVEDYPHQVARDLVLRKLAEACPVCGDVECNESVAYIGSRPIHKSQHPEVKAERARERRGRHQL